MTDKVSPPCSVAPMAQPVVSASSVALPPPPPPLSVAGAVVSSSGVGCSLSNSGGVTPAHTNSTVTVTATSVNSHPPPPPHVHQAIAHPSVPPSPIPQHFHCPQVQVIQQPIHSPTYIPQMYNPQQQLLMPGNITMSPSIQVIAAAGKTCVPNQLATQMIAGKPVLQGQSTNYIPTTTNQTLVIGQLGMLPSQSPTILNPHAKQMADSQKVRPYAMNQAGAIQSKSPILPHPQAAPHVLNGSQFKQLGGQVTSTPQQQQQQQLMTSQAAPAMIASQSQIINSLQAISSVPGLTWTTHGGLQSHAVITAQNPIFIRSNHHQQQDMFIQSSPQGHTPIQPQPPPGGLAPMLQHHQPQHPKPKQGIELAPNIQPKTLGSTTLTKTLSSILPSTVAPIRPASSVATQTNAMAHHGTLHPRPQIKQRAKGHVSRVSPGPGAMHIQQKADAANQTRIHMTMPQIQPKPPTEIKAIAVRSQQQQPPPPLSHNGFCPTVVPTTLSTATLMRADGTMGTVMMPPKVSPSPQPLLLPPPPLPIAKKHDEAMDCASGPNGKDDSKMSLEAHTDLMSLSGGGCIHLPPAPATSLAAVLQPPPAITIMPAEEGRKDAGVPIVLMPPVAAVPCQELTKDKQPQKAIVKPHVLTHVIEGFVIQEAQDPFPVNRSSLLNEFTQTKSDAAETAEGHDMSGANAGMYSPEQASSRDVPTEDKQHDVHLELAKCEFCGKADAKSRFKRSKRFCSTSCAKRSTVVYTQRLGLFTSSGTGLDSPGKYIKKKKHGIKMRKGLRKIQSSGRLTYNTDEWVRSQNSSESPPKEEETNSSNSGGESSLSPTTLSSQKDMMEVDTPEAAPSKNPLKWTVLEVFEFIKALPGCADYADEFRLQEIDGQALLLLKEDHLMTAMNMKLGPALKICARINSLKEEVQRQ